MAEPTLQVESLESTLRLVSFTYPGMKPLPWYLKVRCFLLRTLHRVEWAVQDAWDWVGFKLWKARRWWRLRRELTRLVESPPDETLKNLNDLVRALERGRPDAGHPMHITPDLHILEHRP